MFASTQHARDDFAEFALIRRVSLAQRRPQGVKEFPVLQHCSSSAAQWRPIAGLDSFRYAGQTCLAHVFLAELLLQSI
jgi:hypothetical protein